MEIRLAQESDMPFLLEIFNYEVENSTSNFSIRKRTMAERMRWFRAHNIDRYPLIVADVDGRAAGYASLSCYRDNDAYIHTVELSVYVDHECRRQGIGDALMERILQMGRADEGVHTIVSVITGGNEASIHLHEKYGFEYAGTIKEAGYKFGSWLDIVNYVLYV